MSGRVRWLRDGLVVTGHRKTDRRQGERRPLRERLDDLNFQAIKRRAPLAVHVVYLAFLLPKTLQGFVASGEHGPGIEVFARGFVRIRGDLAERCFGLARDFFATIAKDRPAFTTMASVVGSMTPDRAYARHLTVVRGALVVCAGVVEPQIFEPRGP